MANRFKVDSKEIRSIAAQMAVLGENLEYSIGLSAFRTGDGPAIEALDALGVQVQDIKLKLALLIHYTSAFLDKAGISYEESDLAEAREMAAAEAEAAAKTQTH